MNFYKTVLYLLVCWYSYAWVHAKHETTGWTNKEADVYFLIDSSASIWIVDYKKLLQFVADLVSDMDINHSTAVRVGVGLFSGHHILHIPLNNNWTKEKLRQEIMAAPYLRGDTFLSRALQGMRTEGLSPSTTRASATRICVLITDGMSRHKQLTADNATLAKMDGIFLFTVGVGNGVDRDELREIASDPKKEFYYHVSNFDHLKEIHSKISDRMSQEPVELKWCIGRFSEHKGPRREGMLPSQKT